MLHDVLKRQFLDLKHVRRIVSYLDCFEGSVRLFKFRTSLSPTDKTSKCTSAHSNIGTASDQYNGCTVIQLVRFKRFWATSGDLNSTNNAWGLIDGFISNNENLSSRVQALNSPPLFYNNAASFNDSLSQNTTSQHAVSAPITNAPDPPFVNALTKSAATAGPSIGPPTSRVPHSDEIGYLILIDITRQYETMDGNSKDPSMTVKLMVVEIMITNDMPPHFIQKEESINPVTPSSAPWEKHHDQVLLHYTNSRNGAASMFNNSVHKKKTLKEIQKEEGRSNQKRNQLYLDLIWETLCRYSSHRKWGKKPGSISMNTAWTTVASKSSISTLYVTINVISSPVENIRP
ncbi:20123_t:CDS:10 [Funneliformis geosporum]|nr:20123_t:CDS:10 [Funneliformis geosporum]